MMNKWKVITVFHDGHTDLSEFLWQTTADFNEQVAFHLFNHLSDANNSKRRRIDTIIIQPVTGSFNKFPESTLIPQCP